MSKNKDKILMKMLNDESYFDYLERLKRIALSMFEWKLPKSMDERFLEKTLYERGQAVLLKDEELGFVNLKCSHSGPLNIYMRPIRLNCYSLNKQLDRLVYNGLVAETTKETDYCVHVYNNWERIPTALSIELFARRLAEAERVCDVNLKAQKTPVLITIDETQRLSMEKLYESYNGNAPVIFGDKNQIDPNIIKSINTNAPYVVDKVQQYKKQIWNECLEYLGINSMQTEKKERLITDEASSNNELINFNLQSFLIPRQKACDEFNELFGLKGTDKEISVRLRSDLYNIIKQNESVILDYNNNGIDDRLEGDNNE